MYSVHVFYLEKYLFSKKKTEVCCNVKAKKDGKNWPLREKMHEEEKRNERKKKDMCGVTSHQNKLRSLYHEYHLQCYSLVVTTLVPLLSVATAIPRSKNKSFFVAKNKFRFPTKN